MDKNEKSNSGKKGTWWDNKLLAEHAKYWHGRYGILSKHGIPFTEVYEEAQERLIRAGFKTFSNEWGFLRNLCRNICSEWHDTLINRPLVFPIPDGDGLKQKLFSIIDHYILKLSCPCQTVLNRWYWTVPQTNDRVKIAAEIRERCPEVKQDYSPGAIYVPAFFRKLTGFCRPAKCGTAFGLPPQKRSRNIP